MTGDRPSLGGSLKVQEVSGGLLIYPETGESARIHLNNTAAVVFELCNGERTAEEIAAELAREFGLQAPPADIVRTCVAQLREQGVIRARELTKPGAEAAGRPVRVLAFTCSRDVRYCC